MNLTAKQQLSRNPSNAGYATPLKTYSVPATENADKTLNVPAQPVYGIDPNHEPIDLYMAVRTIPGGIPVRTNSADAITATGLNVIQIGATVQSTIESVAADLTASATVGNRVLVGMVRDGPAGNILWMGTSMAVLTAGQVGGYDVAFGSVGTPSTTVRRNLANTANTNVQVRDFCPIKRFAPGWVFLLIDTANIDANDVLTHKTVRTDTPV